MKHDDIQQQIIVSQQLALITGEQGKYVERIEALEKDRRNLINTLE